MSGKIAVPVNSHEEITESFLETSHLLSVLRPSALTSVFAHPSPSLTCPATRYVYPPICLCARPQF